MKMRSFDIVLVIEYNRLTSIYIYISIALEHFSHKIKKGREIEKKREFLLQFINVSAGLLCAYLLRVVGQLELAQVADLVRGRVHHG